MRKTAIAAVVLATGLAFAGSASAHGGRGGPGWVGAALVGGLVGAAVLSATAPVYAAPAPVYAYAPPPAYAPAPVYSAPSGSCYDSYYRRYVACEAPPAAYPSYYGPGY